MKYLFLLFISVLIFPVFSGAKTKIMTQTTAAISGTSTQLLAANKDRNYLLIQNNGAVTVYVKLDVIHVGTEGIAIVAGGNYEPVEAPKNAIWIVAASGTPSITTFEGLQ